MASRPQSRRTTGATPGDPKRVTGQEPAHRVIAVLGLSPAIITEFLWWLSTKAGVQADAVEIWTTTKGKSDALEMLLGQGVWETLDRSLRLRDRPGLPPIGPGSFRVFGSESQPVDDIRSDADAQLILQSLCNRIRDLHGEAPPVVLHALISGGRKTMSAALQTAVQLFGEEGDTVYHALLHPEIENDKPRAALFPFPSGPWQVGPEGGGGRMLQEDEQVIVARQPIPLLRPLLPAGAFATVADDLVRQLNLRIRDARLEPLKWDLVGNSPAMARIREEVARYAPTEIAILIQGESGTGKEMIARAIHANSGRKGPFQAVNCGAIAAGLVDSELFGHERGAFTGAVDTRIGHFEAAAEGTLFLDEIGELPAELQARLLRVLQEKEFNRVGSAQTRRTDVRIVAATNKDLAKAVDDGEFREDLFFRVVVAPLRVPPLRERPEDLRPLADAFLRELGGADRELTAAAWAKLNKYSWPGNIRELRGEIEVAIARAGTGPVDEIHIQPELRYAFGARKPLVAIGSRTDGPPPISAAREAKDSASSKEALLRASLDRFRLLGVKVNRSAVVRSLRPEWGNLTTLEAKRRLAGWLADDPAVSAHFRSLSEDDEVRKMFDWAMSTRVRSNG